MSDNPGFTAAYGPVGFLSLAAGLAVPLAYGASWQAVDGGRGRPDALALDPVPRGRSPWRPKAGQFRRRVHPLCLRPSLLHQAKRGAPGSPVSRPPLALAPPGDSWREQRSGHLPGREQAGGPRPSGSGPLRKRRSLWGCRAGEAVRGQGEIAPDEAGARLSPLGSLSPHETASDPAGALPGKTGGRPPPAASCGGFRQAGESAGWGDSRVWTQGGSLAKDNLQA